MTSVYTLVNMAIYHGVLELMSPLVVPGVSDYMAWRPQSFHWSASGLVIVPVAGCKSSGIRVAPGLGLGAWGFLRQLTCWSVGQCP